MLTTDGSNLQFHFPWLLTCLHASFASMGTYAMLQLGYFKLSRLGRRENLALVAFSALFTANIAVSNLSLAMVSVPFYQTMRMLCPIFTILIYRTWYGRTYSYMTYLSLVPLIIGAAMTTAGEMTFTDAGFLLTILGVILAAVKVCHLNVSQQQIPLQLTENLDRCDEPIHDWLLGIASGRISHAYVTLGCIASPGVCYCDRRSWWLQRTGNLWRYFSTDLDRIANRKWFPCIPPQYFLIQYQQACRCSDNDGVRQPEAVSYRLDWNLSL